MPLSIALCFSCSAVKVLPLVSLTLVFLSILDCVELAVSGDFFSVFVVLGAAGFEVDCFGPQRIFYSGGENYFY